MSDRNFIEKIVAMAEPKAAEINGRMYTNQNLHVVKEPEVKPVKLTGLKSLLEIIANEAEHHIKSSKLFININSEESITVFGVLQDYSRKTYYEAVPDLPDTEQNLNTFISVERMIIFLNTNFIKTDERDYLIQLLSNITNEKSVKATDDGLSQTVNVKQGIALAGTEKVRNILTLRPYRTFLEAEQAEEKFMPRLDGNGKAALFEADGGMWKIEAKKNVSKYLNDNLAPELRGMIKILD
jgi:hypothetical protein